MECMHAVVLIHHNNNVNLDHSPAIYWSFPNGISTLTISYRKKEQSLKSRYAIKVIFCWTEQRFQIGGARPGTGLQKKIYRIIARIVYTFILPKSRPIGIKF